MGCYSSTLRRCEVSFTRRTPLRTSIPTPQGNKGKVGFSNGRQPVGNAVSELLSIALSNFYYKL